MGHWIGAQAQVRALAKAVSAAFAASNLTEEEKSPNKIEITDLPWQAPPLITEATLGGIPLQDYLDVPLALTDSALVTFWQRTLHQMWYTPTSLLRRGVYSATGSTMPKVKVGQRAFRFPRPAGFPGQMDDTSGVAFSLEVAHAAAISVPIADLVASDNDYYVILPDGREIGVKQGRPACESPWVADLSGMVPDLLRMSRGDTDFLCRFDQLASLRSVLHVHRARFPRNFDGLDQALQALRLLTFGGHCPDLVHEMYVAPIDAMTTRAHEQTLRDAIEVIAEPNMSDRSKLHVMHSLLVPGVLSGTGFRQHIFAGNQWPFTLAAGRMDQIEAWLRQEYESRIPADFRQLKGQEK